MRPLLVLLVLLALPLLLCACAAPSRYQVHIRGPLSEGPCYAEPSPGRESCAARFARWQRGYETLGLVEVQVEAGPLTMDDLDYQTAGPGGTWP